MCNQKAIPSRIIVALLVFTLLFSTNGLSRCFAADDIQNNYIAVSAGDGHTVALMEDGTVWAWGINTSGQIGNGDRGVVKSPTKIDGLSNIIAIDANRDFTLALRSDGTVWAWGGNEFGVLGDDLPNRSFVPLKITGLNNIIAVAAGDTHCAAVSKDGTVFTWGRNAFGQLGNGTGYKKTSIITQVSGVSNIKAVAVGKRHTLALKSDGTVWAWGNNEEGQLGTNPGSREDTGIASQIKGFTGAIAISAGEYHSAALMDDGTVWIWGSNEYGQLAKSTKQSVTVPTLVDGLTNIKSIALGRRHSVVLKNDGTVWTWGGNNSGQLGTGNSDISINPTQVNGLSNIASISTHVFSTTALDTSGKLWTWGDASGSSPQRVLYKATEAPVVTTEPSTIPKPTVSPNNGYTTTNTIFLKIDDSYMTVNGSTKEIDPGNGTSPIVEDGRTMIPIRALIEIMGGTVGWDEKESKVIIKLNNNNLEMGIDKKVIKLNDTEKPVDAAPKVINGRTMVPVRFVAENLGCSVAWDEDSQKITIKFTGKIPVFEPDERIAKAGEGIIKGNEYILDGKVLFNDKNGIISALLSPDKKYVAYTWSQMEVILYDIEKDTKVTLYDMPLTEAYGTSYMFKSVAGNRINLIKWTADSQKIIFKKYNAAGFSGGDGNYEINKDEIYQTPVVTQEN